MSFAGRLAKVDSHDTRCKAGPRVNPKFAGVTQSRVILFRPPSELFKGARKVLLLLSMPGEAKIL